MALGNIQVGLNRPMDSIALRAVAARRFAKLTQKQAEAASGVKQSDISKIERGDTERPAGLLALARAYKVDPHWLDTGDGVPPWEDPQARPTKQESSTRTLVTQLATLAARQRPTLRKNLGNLLVELVENPEDEALVEQTIVDIERFFGKE